MRSVDFSASILLVTKATISSFVLSSLKSFPATHAAHPAEAHPPFRNVELASRPNICQPIYPAASLKIRTAPYGYCGEPLGLIHAGNPVRAEVLHLHPSAGNHATDAEI